MRVVLSCKLLTRSLSWRMAGCRVRSLVYSIKQAGLGGGHASMGVESSVNASRMGVQWSIEMGVKSSVVELANKSHAGQEILLPFCWWLYSHSTHILRMILFYWWFSLVILLSTDCTPILLLIRSPFYWQYSTDDSILILLTVFYWSFWSHSTEHSATILLEILLPFFWWLYSNSTHILLMNPLPFYGSLFHSNLHDSTPILRITLPF